MGNLLFYAFVFIAYCFTIVNSFFDPLSLSALGAAGLGAYNFDYLKEQTYCRFQECCDKRSIPGDIRALRNKLFSLYGQHIVTSQLVPALEAHFATEKSRKPLVISLHGPPGTGKSYVADLIADSIYLYGTKSKFVHKYLGRSDFPTASRAEEYKERINREVRAGIAACPRSLFIFDEVDKMPPGVFESLASLVDYNALDKNDNTQAIFLFLSSTAGVHISDRLGELIKQGHERENVKLKHFKEILQVAAYNMAGGMQKTTLIEGHLIDHYLPFLPLEKTHVTQCIKTELGRWNLYGAAVAADDIEAIIEDAVTYDRTYGIFVTAGCKAIEKRVAIFVKENSLK